MDNKTYAYSFDGVDYGDEYARREDALFDAVSELAYDKKDKGYIYIGECKREFKPHIDALSIIDDLQEDAYVSEGGDYAEDYLEGVTQSQVDELEQGLNKVLNDWIKEYHLQPRWYTVIRYDVYRYENGKVTKMKGQAED